jgi:hypothetical protein
MNGKTDKSTDLRRYEVLDEALESISSSAPELANGFTNHAPMAMEALCALGRGDAVLPWLNKYRKSLLPLPPPHRSISSHEWPHLLGRLEFASEWLAFFENELKEASWMEVLDRWASRLAPGFCAAANHGVIRTGHAVRALAVSETPTRLRELAHALAYWAATYQTLPSSLSANNQTAKPQEAILKVPIVPKEKRRFAGSITSSFEALDESSGFAGVINLVDPRGDITEVLTDLTETFSRVFLANAHDALSTIIFVHGVTGIAALRSLAPHLGALTARRLVPYAWQSSCAIYSVFGSAPKPLTAVEEPPESYDNLMEMAIFNGDEHAIKFTEACARESRLRPADVYRSAARQALFELGKNSAAR